MAPAESRSGGNVEQFGDEVGLSPHVSSTNFPNLPLPAHRHHLIVSQCSSCCVEIARARPRFDQVFHACVVLSKNVTEEADFADSRPREANRFSPSGRGAWVLGTRPSRSTLPWPRCVSTPRGACMRLVLSRHRSSAARYGPAPPASPSTCAPLTPGPSASTPQSDTRPAWHLRRRLAPPTLMGSSTQARAIRRAPAS